MKSRQPPEIPNTHWGYLGPRLTLGLVLCIAGIFKAGSPAEELAVVIEAYQIVPPDAAMTLARFLPGIEILLGFSLIAGYFTRISAVASGALILAFITSLLFAKARAIPLPNCGCFGPNWHPTATTALIMDIGLALFAFLTYTKGNRLKLGLDHWISQGR